MSQGDCIRALPKRLQDLLKAGNENPQTFTDLASCIETVTEEYYDDYTGETTTTPIETTVKLSCLKPYQESLGVSAYDAFLVRRILNGTNEPITEAKLKAGFSDTKTMKEYNKEINDGLSFEDELASFVAKIILVLHGLVCILDMKSTILSI